jgi:hypothetical protein
MQKRTKYVNPLIFKDLLRKKRRPWRIGILGETKK